MNQQTIGDLLLVAPQRLKHQFELANVALFKELCYFLVVVGDDLPQEEREGEPFLLEKLVI